MDVDLDRAGVVGSKERKKRQGCQSGKVIKKEETMKKVSIAILVLFFLFGGVIIDNGVRASEKYPVKPITCILAIEAGGDADVNARPVMERASAILGKPIIIVNKPGAGNTIGYREVYQAKPDGYTIGIATLSLVTVKLQGLFPYDHHDFTLLGSFNAHYPMIVASTKTKRPFTTIQELFSFAKSNPGEVSMATGTVGNAYWVATMLLAERTGLKFNVIPQPGSGAFIVTQVGGGHSDVGITGGSTAKPHIDAGNFRPLATMGRTRLPKFPDVPTLKELGYDVVVHSFIAAMGPPKMPKDITEKLTKALEIASNDPEYQKFLIQRYDTPYYMGPEQLFNFYEDQRKVYRTFFAEAGLLKEK